MKFSEIVDQATALLQRKGRLSYRALTREFELDESALEDLKDELIDIQELAADKDGKMLVWTGEPQSADTPAQTQPQSPASYTPPHLAEKILQSRSALEGERKQVTVLFADVKSSTELAEEVGPEEWRRREGRPPFAAPRGALPRRRARRSAVPWRRAAAQAPGAEGPRAVG